MLTDRTEDSVTATPTRRMRPTLLQPEVLRWTAVIVVARIVLLQVVILLIRDGSDPSRDLGYHIFLAEAPWSHIDQSWLPQYPPFLGVAEALTYEPWMALGLPAPTSLRLGAIVWDVLAGWLVIGTVRLMRPEGLKLAGLLYALAPLTWVASAGAGQDETIAGAFVAGSLFCIASGRRGWARGIGVVGLFTAKLLLLPVLAVLAASRPAGRRLRDLAVSGAAVLGCAALLWLAFRTDGLTSQTSYKPEWVTFSVSPWGPLVGRHHVSARLAHFVGQALATLVAAGLVAMVLRRSDELRQREPGSSTSLSPLVAAHLTAALFLGCFAVLTVVNPEYIAIVGPALVVVAVNYKDAAWITGLACLPWLADGAFALIRRGPEQDSWPVFGPVHWTPDGGTAGHQTLVRLHLLLAIASSAAMLAAAIVLVRRLPQASTASTASPADAASD